MATHIYTTGIDGPYGSSFALRIFSGERLSYSWNPSCVDEFIQLDYGLNSLALTPTTVIDGGSINDVEAVTVDDWGRIIYTDTVRPYGFVRPKTATTWTVLHAWVGTGTVFEMVGSYYRLSAPWIVQGTVRVTGSAVTHWVPDLEFDGLFGIQSLTTEAFSKKESGEGHLYQIGSGAVTRSISIESKGLFRFKSSAGVSFRPNWVGYGTAKVSGEVQQVKRTFGFEGTGTLPNINSEDNRRAYSYNNSSVVPFDYEDYGTIPVQSYQVISTNQVLTGISTGSVVQVNPTITATVDPSGYQIAPHSGTFTNSIEHAPISIGKTTNTDWGLLSITGTLYPFGLGQLKGTAKQNYVPNWIGRGDIKVFGKGRGRTKPRWNGFVRSMVRGVLAERITASEIGSGVLFNFSRADEAFVFSYEGTGNLYKIGGGEERVTTDYLATGALAPLQSNVKVNFVPNWRGSGTIPVTGAVSDVKRTYGEQPFGVIPVFTGDAYAERVTWDYNDSSIVPFGYTDFGPLPGTATIEEITTNTILSGTSTGSVVRINVGVVGVVDPDYTVSLVSNFTAGSTFDYGSIAEGYSGNIDWGYISQTVWQYPFGGFQYTSHTHTSRSVRFIAEKTFDAAVKIRSSTWVRINPQWNGFIVLKASGSATYSVTRPYIGEGRAFSIVYAEASRVFDYVGEGQIYKIGGAVESVSFNPDEKQALFPIRGVADVRFAPNWNAFGTLWASHGTAEPVLRSFAYEGTGVLPTIISTEKSRTYSYNDSSENLYEYRDYASLPGVGTVTTITPSQNLSGTSPTSIIRIGLNGVVATVPLGQTYGIDPWLSAGATTIHDCGFITDPGATVREDYGFTSVFSPIRTKVSEYPFGKLVSFTSLTHDSQTKIFISDPIPWEHAIKIRSDSEVRVPPQWVTNDPTLWTWSGAAECTVVIPPTTPPLFKFAGGYTDLKFITAEEGSAHMEVSGRCQEAVVSDNYRYVVIDVTGNAGENFSLHFHGFGNLYSIGRSAEAITIDIPAFQADLTFGGLASQRFTASEQVTVDIDLSGTALEKHTEDWVGQSRTEIFNVSVVPLITKHWTGEGRIFNFSGAVEAFTFNPLELTALFDFTGRLDESRAIAIAGLVHTEVRGTSSPEILTFAEQPFGRTEVYGQADILRTHAYHGDGQVFSVGGAAESLTLKLPEFTADAVLKGAVTQSFTFGGIIGSGVFTVSGEIADPLLTFAEQPLGDIYLSGDAVVVNVDIHFGVGGLFSIGAADEAITLKLPAFQADIAFSPEKAGIRAAYREIGQAEILFSGEVSEPILTFAEQPRIEVDIFGASTSSRSHVWVGEGRIFAISGAAESITFVLPEFQADMVFKGFGGFIRTFSERFTIESKLSGTARIKYIPNWIGSGGATIDVTSTFSRTRDFIGEGRIFNISGASESVTFNPEERQLLFSIGGTRTSETVAFSPDEVPVPLDITGEAFERFTPNNIGSGTIYVDVTTSVSRTRDFVGEGRIFNISGASESFTVNPDETTALFSFGGTKTERVTTREVLFGTLFAFSGASESVGVVPEATGLFTFKGRAEEATTYAEVGFGNLFNFVSSIERRTFHWNSQIDLGVSGIADEKHTEAYSGIGRLWGFAGAAETITFSPELYGVVNVFGVADTPRTRVTVGTGSFFTWNNASESRTITVENVAIFDFLGVARQAVARNIVTDVAVEVRGSGAESFTRKGYVGEGSAQFFGESASSITTTHDGSGRIDVFEEDNVPVIVKAFVGSGRIPSLASAEVLRTFSYDGHCPIEIDITTKVIAPYQRFVSEGGVILHVGDAETRRIQVAPPRSYGWII